jgi:hypothetical protein
MHCRTGPIDSFKGDKDSLGHIVQQVLPHTV